MRRDQDRVEEVFVAALLGDAELLALLGGPHVSAWDHGREHRVPSVRYKLVSDPLTERVARITYQFDCWAESRASLNAIVQRVERILHHDTRRVFGGIEMATLIVDGRELDDPRPGVLRYSLDVRFEPARTR